MWSFMANDRPVMLAETISLGILALPSALATLGMIPGVALILGLGILSTYTGYVIGQFRLVYPWVRIWIALLCCIL